MIIVTPKQFKHAKVESRIIGGTAVGVASAALAVGITNMVITSSLKKSNESRFDGQEIHIKRIEKDMTSLQNVVKNCQDALMINGYLK